MNKQKLISIEGISGVGKTTITKNLSSKIDNLKHIGESFNFLKENETFPDIFTETDEGLINNHKFLIDLEIRKNKEISKLLSEGKNVLTERSFLTLIYTEISLKRLGFRNNLNHLINDLRNIYNSGELLIPDHFILLKTDPQIAQKRILAREGNKNHFFSDIKTLKQLDNDLFGSIDLYKKFLKDLFNMTIIENNEENNLYSITNKIELEIKYILNL